MINANTAKSARMNTRRAADNLNFITWIEAVKSCPKPTKKDKPKRQRVYVRYECGCYSGVMFRAEIQQTCNNHGAGVEKIYPLGTKYISEHAALVDLLDRVCSELVRRRDGYQCVLCGSRQQPQNGHVLVRDLYGTRWHLKNQNCQCGACNILHGKRGQAHHYYAWFQAKWGMEEWSSLVAASELKNMAGGKAWTVPELQAMLTRYEALLERLKTLAVYDEAMLREIGAWG